MVLISFPNQPRFRHPSAARPHRRAALAPLAAVLVAALALACSGNNGAPAEEEAAAGVRGLAVTEVLWDEWGVPHIFAPDPERLMFAFGWAQARSHGDLLLTLYGRSRGRAAEYWGAEQGGAEQGGAEQGGAEQGGADPGDEAELDSDIWVRRVGIPARAEAWYEAQPPEWKARLDAFAGGVNAYAERHREALDDAAERVLPVSARDVLAHTLHAIHYTFVVNRWEVAGAARRLGGTGSNAWAVAPRRSASGHALLVANPHLPWSDLFTWYEVQLRSPEVDAYGATLVGLPILGIAFNDHLGWTHTVNTHDGADLYELTLEGGGYRFDGEVRPFEESQERLRVRRADGDFDEETLTVRRSVHGPVVAEGDGKALALRLVGLDDAGLVDQYWQMLEARNLGQFEAALSRLQVPMFTVLYADRDGHVLHLFGGRTPVRPAGEWDWSGAVPGDTSETLWTATHAYEELPRVLDPPSGWLQNANDPPWTTTFPRALDPAAFPGYLAPRFMHLRAQRSARLLAEDESITFDELVEDKLSTRMEAADRLLDDLARAVEAHGGAAARRAMEVLAAWDRTADAASRGGVLFAAFFREIGGDDAFATPWSAEAPMETPDGLADPRAAAAALERAARRVEADHGALDVAWGEVFRLRRNGRDLPANGGPGSLGIFRVVGFEPDGDGRFQATSGDSYVAVTEFGPTVRARALLSYGNSSQPGSPHNGDQLELFAAKQLRPVWRSREEIEAHLEEREDLSPLAGGK